MHIMSKFTSSWIFINLSIVILVVIIDIQQNKSFSLFTFGYINILNMFSLKFFIYKPSISTTVANFPFTFVDAVVILVSLLEPLTQLDEVGQPFLFLDLVYVKDSASPKAL